MGDYRIALLDSPIARISSNTYATKTNEIKLTVNGSALPMISSIDVPLHPVKHFGGSFRRSRRLVAAPGPGAPLLLLFEMTRRRSTDKAVMGARYSA